MKHLHLNKLICLLLSLVLLAGCAAPAQSDQPATAPEQSGAAAPSPAPEVETEQTQTIDETLAQLRAMGQSPDDNYRAYYEVFVYSFCDSNGDGIGDLQGLISRLDYLQDLGITGLWLMPVHPSTTYHKYNVSDYCAIDPDYGTMEDMQQLLDACQQRGIRVILDLVVNHTGYEHPWFRQAAEYLSALPEGAEPDPAVCPYVDYYFFTREPGSGDRILNDTDWYYEGQFSADMPDLNLQNPAVREEIAAIMAFWLDRGVAGFRIDAAKEFDTGNVQANVEILSWMQQTATSLREDAYLVAEVWDSFHTVTQYYESGITSIFNYPFGNSDGKIISVIRGTGNASVVSTYATALEKADAAYSGQNPDYIDAPFLSNHDVGRIAGFCSGSEEKTKLAGAMNILMSGSCFIYYGEEIGMVGSGNDPSKRAPMVWSNDGAGMTQPPPECVLPDGYPFGSLADQASDDGSIYNYYRQAIAIRNALPVISHGRTTVETSLNVGCISAQRKTWNDETCLILMNVDENPAQVELTDYAQWTLAAALSANGQPITLEGALLTLPPYGVAVLRP